MQMMEEWEVAWRNVECESVLAEGSFGEVWSGWWNGVTVAIKFIKRSRPDGDIPQECVLPLIKPHHVRRRTGLSP